MVHGFLFLQFIKAIGRLCSEFHFDFYSTPTTRFGSHLRFLYVVSYWLIMILLYLI